MKSIVHGATSVALDRVRTQYTDLLSSGSFSLQQLFNPDQFRLQDYCKQFSPHPRSEELKKIAQAFGENYGVWLQNAKHHITCALFLYPTASDFRMLAMMKNLIIDFYLNDVMGRDTYKFLTAGQQLKAKEMIRKMSSIGEDLQHTPGASLIEKANAGVLMDFKNTSTPDWFSRFFHLYNYHISVTHQDGNAAAQGYIRTVEEYIELRCHLAGMHHIVLWIEYGDDQFLNWNWLAQNNLANSMRELHYVSAAFGALSNDLFSFEKEVIDNGSDSNLLMAIALNNRKLGLKEIIFQAAEKVKDLLSQFLKLVDLVKKHSENLQATPEKAVLANNIEGLERCVQASWLWQVYTNRYKREHSIWMETQLPAATAAKAV